MANGDVQLDENGDALLDPDGNVLLSGGAPCCFLQAFRCDDDTPLNTYALLAAVDLTKFYAIEIGETCTGIYFAEPQLSCVPDGATVLGTSDLSDAHDTCTTDCTRLYRQARDCDTNELIDLWMPVGYSVAYGGVFPPGGDYTFVITCQTGDDPPPDLDCIIFRDSDPPVAFSPEDAAALPLVTGLVCWALMRGGFFDEDGNPVIVEGDTCFACSNFWRPLRKCSDGSRVNRWVNGGGLLGPIMGGQTLRRLSDNRCYYWTDADPIVAGDTPPGPVINLADYTNVENCDDPSCDNTPETDPPEDGPCLEALNCSDDQPSGLYFDFAGVDDGQVWRQPDESCVYADLSRDATDICTPEVDQTDPQLSCDDCEEVAAPCDCPADLATTFTLLDASGNLADQAGMSCCQGPCPGGGGGCPEWDNILVQFGDPTDCIWIGPSAGENTEYMLSAGGKHAVFLAAVSLVDPGGGDPCYWQLAINYYTIGPVLHDWWTGRKYVGLDPTSTGIGANTYTRVSGGAVNGTLNIGA